MKTPVYSLSICGRMILDMHSLNNEGGEGNQITTRMVTIVDERGELHSVNAISGDMLKHIQAEHLYRLARGRLDLCDGCQIFSASRALDDRRFEKSALPKKDADTVDLLLRTCALDDMEGNLIAAGNRSVPRKSVVEFGWVVGLPEHTKTESYFHVRYAAERGGDEKVSQPIFHRPASSGIYAAVANFEMCRIGFNDITQMYALDSTKRLDRYTALLESILYTFVEPAGAMRGTQNPHIIAFKGVVTVSHDIMPAPTISPLVDTYLEQVKGVAQALGGDGRLAVHQFDDMAGFAGIMQELIANTRPYTMFGEKGG